MTDIAAQYSNSDIYIVLKNHRTLPAECTVGGEPAERIGEGVSCGLTAGDELWHKDCFYGIEEIRALVHAEDAGDVVLKSASEMREAIAASAGHTL